MRFYHTTATENVQPILSTGLQCSQSNLWKGMGGAIYLSRGDIWWHEQPDYTLLAIDLPMSFIKNHEVRIVDNSEVLVLADIPPKFVSVLF